LKIVNFFLKIKKYLDKHDKISYNAGKS